MPYVNIKITKENTTKEQKQKLVSGVTKLLEKILVKNTKTTMMYPKIRNKFLKE